VETISPKGVIARSAATKQSRGFRQDCFAPSGARNDRHTWGRRSAPALLHLPLWSARSARALSTGDGRVGQALRACSPVFASVGHALRACSLHWGWTRGAGAPRVLSPLGMRAGQALRACFPASASVERALRACSSPAVVSGVGAGLVPARSPRKGYDPPLPR